MFHKKTIISLSTLFIVLLFCQKPNTLSQVGILKKKALMKILNESDKLIVVNVWATWCQPCREEFPELEKYYNAYASQIKFLSVSVDYPDEIQDKVLPFIKIIKPSFPVYIQGLNSEEEFINLIDSSWNGALPATFFFKKGKLKIRLDGKVNFRTLKKTGEGLRNEEHHFMDGCFYPIVRLCEKSQSTGWTE